MSEFAVADASMAFKRLVEEENSGKATIVTRLWDQEGTQLATLALAPLELAAAPAPASDARRCGTLRRT